MLYLEEHMPSNYVTPSVTPITDNFFSSISFKEKKTTPTARKLTKTNHSNKKQ